MYSYRKIALLSCVGATLAIAGCSGGGSGASSSQTLFPLKAGNTTIKGNNHTVGYTVDGTDGVVVDSANSQSLPITAVVTHDGDDVTKVALTAGSDTRTWSVDDPDTVTESVNNGQLFVAKTADGSITHTLGFADPDSAENKFQYQTYGAWQDGDDFTGNVRVFSVGRETALADIPTGGSSATFKGTAGGVYANGVDDPLTMTAKAELSVDFAAKTATFGTSDTYLHDTGASTQASNLNMAGSMTIGATGQLSGTVSTTGANMSGDIDGRFYGPGAKEVGGTFLLTGTGVDAGTALGGGYGAVKQ